LASVKYPALDLRFAAGPGAGTFQDMLYAELDTFEPVAIQEHDSGDGWRVFFRTAALRDQARAALASEFGNALLDLVAEDVDDEDWARRSQASLKAVRVGRIVVAPPWDAASASASASPTGMRDAGSGMRNTNLGRRASNPGSRVPDPDILIVIDPSMGFGTGHHATTRLCLELLQRLDLVGKRVIDVGTGSGVLALAAWALGASSVTAVDHDPDALQNARENIIRNRAAAEIEVIEVDLSSVALPPADIVLANLTAAVLLRYAASLQRLVVAGGQLVVSGFSPDDVDAVGGAIGADVREVVREGEWAAALLSRGARL
jgi:ribosomal protein L11 methylase PrmA